MIWHHGIPYSSKVFLLLLLLLFPFPSESSKDCIFKYIQFASTHHSEYFSDQIKNLTEYLLLDYPVSVPSNLKTDEFCQELWELHLINRKLTSLMNVSGNILSQKISSSVKQHLDFIIKNCKIEDSCVSFMETNITQFLQPIPSLIEKLANKMELLIMEGLADFSNCTMIQCQLDSSTPPVIQSYLQTQERIWSSQPAPTQRSYWSLLLLSIPVVCLPFLVRHLWRKLFQRPPRFQESVV